MKRAAVRPAITEHDYEPVPGLPARLPAAEQLLWQGAPDAWRYALHAYRLRELAAYFGVLLVVRAAWLAAGGAAAPAVLAGLVGPALASLAALGIVGAIARASARATLYTITTQRVVIRQGVALTATVNLPFRSIESAALKVRSDGSGDVALALAPGQRASWLVLWPHVRPWHLLRAQPALRDLPDAARVGEILSRAFAQAVPALVAPRTAAAGDRQGAATPAAA